MPRCHPSWTPFFNRVLIDFYSQLRLPESQKSSPRCSESTIFQKIAFRNWHRFLIDFGANLAPSCLPKSTKILPKIDPKRHQKNDRFFIDFLSFFDWFWSPTWGHVGHFFGQNEARLWDSAPFFVALLFWIHFFRNYDPFWFHFGAKLAPFWLHFAAILVPSWRYLGPLGRTSLHWMGWWGYAI